MATRRLAVDGAALARVSISVRSQPTIPLAHQRYDLFWDVPGHINRFNKVQEGPWEPMPGP